MTSDDKHKGYLEHRALRLRLTELVTLRSWGELTNEQYVELDRIVSIEPMARELYFEIMLDTATLGRQAGHWRVAQSSEARDAVILASEQMAKSASSSSVLGFLGASVDPAPALPNPTVTGFLGAVVNLSTAWLASPKALALTVAGGLATYFVGLMVSLAISRIYSEQSAENARPEIGAAAPAQILASAAARWVGGNNPSELGTKLPAGIARLAEGVVELNFDGGARVRVEGPAEFEAKSAGRIELARGRLSAHVPRRARGFTVSTPTAEIIDLGTEFGVEVESSGLTNVEVHRGTVEVSGVVQQSGGSAPISVTRLHAGEATRIDAQRIGPVVRASGQVSIPWETSVSPKPPVGLFDLVDIVAGGDGRGRRRNLGINPADGQVLLPPSDDYSHFGCWLEGDGKYHAVVDRPLIDGVAIPMSGEFPLDSAGHVFRAFPQTNRRAYGPVWAGGSLPQPPGHPPLCTTFDGKVDYADEPHGLIAMIPNKLVTFDLEAIRRAHRLSTPGTFRAVVGVTKPKGTGGERGLADAWVFVDGQLRYSRQAINSAHGSELAEVTLQNSARFLTLAATDAGDTPDFDYLFFGDPVIQFDKDDNPRPSRQDMPSK